MIEVVLCGTEKRIGYSVNGAGYAHGEKVKLISCFNHLLK